MSVHSIRVLVIEDILVAQIAEATMLENLGCHVDVANTGTEALRKTRQAPDYDLIFLDLGLPDIDALTVTESILQHYHQHLKSPPPIIALTAHAYTSLEEACRKAGMSDFLAKPLTEDSARTLLKKYAK